MNEAAPSQEPVAWMDKNRVITYAKHSESDLPLYTHPSDTAAQIADLSQLLQNSVKAIADYDRQVAQLQAELETERMRLAACGTAALGYFNGCKDEYRSASLDDVLTLRAKCDQLQATLRQARESLEPMRDARDDTAVQRTLAAIDAVLSGAPPSELSDERIRELKKQLNDEGKIGLIAFARAVLAEGRKG